MRKTIRLVVGLLIVAGLVYLAGPLWAGWHLRQGVITRNVALLEAHVDWPQLRANLKPRISAAIRENAANSNIVTGTLKRALGGALSDTAVDALVTPANLRRILAGRAFIIRKPETPKPETPSAPVSAPPNSPASAVDDDAEDPDDPMPTRRLRWAFFESPTRFRVEAVNPRLPGSRIVSTLALEGLAWKLVDVDIVKR